MVVTIVKNKKTKKTVVLSSCDCTCQGSGSIPTPLGTVISVTTTKKGLTYLNLMYLNPAHRLQEKKTKKKHK